MNWTLRCYSLMSILMIFWMCTCCKGPGSDKQKICKATCERMKTRCNSECDDMKELRKVLGSAFAENGICKDTSKCSGSAWNAICNTACERSDSAGNAICNTACEHMQELRKVLGPDSDGHDICKDTREHMQKLHEVLGSAFAENGICKDTSKCPAYEKNGICKDTCEHMQKLHEVLGSASDRRYKCKGTCECMKKKCKKECDGMQEVCTDQCTKCRNACRTGPSDYDLSMDLCQLSCAGVCSECPMSDCEQIILIDGGFTGKILNNYDNSNDNSSCLNIYNGSAPFNYSTCILSFDTDPEEINDTFTFRDTGVWLLKSNNSYQINITRTENHKPKTPICFINGTQNCSWTIEWLANCSQPRETRTWQCEIMTCVDPKKLCEHAQYKTCSINSSNDNIITLNGPISTCQKCGNALKAVDGRVEVEDMFQNATNITSYDKVMTKIIETVLEMMGNKTSVSVTMNNIPGIFVKPESKEDLKPIYFMYSNMSNFNMIEDQTQMEFFENTFSVPKEAFEKAVSMNISTPFASLFRFPNFKQDVNNSVLLNNAVYSINMGGQISNLSTTLNLTFRQIDQKLGEPSCSSWDGQGPNLTWTTDGCNTSYINGSVTCECQHLTFFAVLMVPVTKVSNSDLNNLTFITSIGCGLSLFFLAIGLFMHFLLRKGQASISVHILINLFVALFLLNLSFLVNESVANTGNVIGCKFMAGVMHYTMLSTFTWFGLQALHLCLQLAQNVASIQNYIIKLCVAGWVPPVLVVSAIFISQKYNKEVIVSDTGKNISMCWITDSTVHYAVNIGYYSIIFLFTLLTFVVMLRWLFLLRSKRPIIPISKKSRPSDALSIMGLCSNMGLSWGFAFFAYGPMQIPGLYIFTILNSLQGFFLFIYYYQTSRQVGEPEERSDHTGTEVTEVENPYGKHKTF
ncbi:adhesion G-protein coupled receptor G6 [Neoarius graeffei]|uniref:adhesion G-protein coupled receptor G6 n=1 Tax=Neoarius graeffei TaxID=443677 RepID=UPI00298CBF88|nr:adhesion G-protein coupled receptor G6 [Neoarius graeffei]